MGQAGFATLKNVIDRVKQNISSIEKKREKISWFVSHVRHSCIFFYVRFIYTSVVLTFVNDFFISKRC
jgi:hypothetical protein